MSTVPNSLPGSVTPLRVPDLRPGERVRITQRIVGGNRTWVQAEVGVVESCRAEKTGSWFAHGKDGKLWLMRIRLRKDDGELTTLVVDQHSVIERVGGEVRCEM